MDIYNLEKWWNEIGKISWALSLSGLQNIVDLSLPRKPRSHISKAVWTYSGVRVRVVLRCTPHTLWTGMDLNSRHGNPECKVYKLEIVLRCVSDNYGGPSFSRNWYSGREEVEGLTVSCLVHWKHRLVIVNTGFNYSLSLLRYEEIWECMCEDNAMRMIVPVICWRCSDPICNIFRGVPVIWRW